MPLSWNEIRARATTFVRDWVDEKRERAEAQTFWNEFFHVFGIRRRTVASFEEPVRQLNGKYGFIDLFWKGVLIAEHKSEGGDLGKAHSQAMEYVQDLQRDGRQDEAPRFIVVSDFANFALHNLEPQEGESETVEFALGELPEQARMFAFIAGYETRRLDPEDPANFKATQLLANLHDRLKEGGYGGHDLERFMVRILFCLFAEDSAIFEPESFTRFILYHTREDGSDLGAQLNRMFEVLNTPHGKRQRNLDEDLAILPYVNGELFGERLNFADFNESMRTALIVCCNFRWSKISPAVFGSLFQNIMEDRERRQLGAHYTSERDIMKVVRSLFLDDYRELLHTLKNRRKELADFHRSLGELRFLDPACGCGNFLVIAYRELRRLEMDVIQARFGNEPTEADIRAEARMHVGQFYGIEMCEWPARIAEVAMWLMDHQMNTELFERFGQVKATTPLTRSPHIMQANAMTCDWNALIPAEECSFILGNPPFVGKHLMDDAQQLEMDAVFEGVSGSGILDYVCGWYLKAAKYSRGRGIPIAFVSTNSVCQGEQVGVLWDQLLRLGAKIHFAHRTFAWTSEARGRAHVHVVIIGWGLFDRKDKKIFDYEENSDEPTVSSANNISPYLVDGPDTVVRSRGEPLEDVPPCIYGSKPVDGGFLIVEERDREALLARVSEDAESYLRPLLCAEEYLYNIPRWCLWLVDAPPELILQNDAIVERIEGCRSFRLRSKKASTRALADNASVFAEIRQPSKKFIVVPQHTSENRQYIPFGFFGPETIVHNSCSAIPKATLYHFGVLSSTMHMTWVRQVCGRIKSDYRYSTQLVYNNFPWPRTPSKPARREVEKRAQAVLEARKLHPQSTLASLYDPIAMPQALRRAHSALDKAVDRCYRKAPFTDHWRRLEYLFRLYDELTAPLAVGLAASPSRKAKRARVR